MKEHAFFERSLPAAEGVRASDLAELYRYLEDPALGLHSFMAVRHGKVIAEAWWNPYAPEKPHTLFSASKSFTGLAVGLAAEDGLLSLTDKVVSFFPERLPARTGEYMEKMTVKDLLTMSTGFAKDPHDFPWPRPDDVNGTGAHCCHAGIELPLIDWIRGFFDHYVSYEPGTEFVYSTEASYMLSAIVQKAVGCTVSEYLNRKMFIPMGIGEPFWEESPDGVSCGGWGLMLTTEELAAVGQMMLNGGVFNGRRILPEAYIRDATSPHVSTAHLGRPFCNGYGYQIWLDDREGTYMFQGAFGQILAVIPGKDMVLSYTSGANRPERDKVWNHIWELLLDRVDKEPAKEAEAEKRDQAELNRLTAGMKIPAAKGKPSWEMPEKAVYSGREYLLGDNRLNFSMFSMKFAGNPGETDRLTMEVPEGRFTVPVGYGCFAQGKTCVPTEKTDTDVSVVFESVSCSGAWTDKGYHLILCFDETSYINEMMVEFTPGGIKLHHSRICSFYPAVNAFLTGVEDRTE